MIPVLSGLREIAGSYDGFVIDLWGVLHDGTTAYPGAADCLERLAALGKRTALLSNAPRRAAELAAAMARMGIAERSYTALVCSGEVVHQSLRDRTDPWFARLGRRFFLVGTERDRSLYDGLDLERVGRPDQADFLLNTGPDRPEETVADYAALLATAQALGLPMICANPDRVAIRQGRECICAGSLADHYESIGGFVVWRGKPDPAIYQDCLRALGLADRRRVLAIGDGFPTDVAGAKAAGLDCLLVTGGIHAVEIGTRYGRRPDPERVEAAVARRPGLRPVAAVGGFLW